MVIEPLYRFNLRWRPEKMRKKIVKAHQGMAHVPKPSGQQAPSKAKGTAGTTPRPKRMIGLPQRFKGGRRTAVAPQAPPTARPIRPMPKPEVQQKPVGPIRDNRPPPIQSPNKPTGNPFPKGSHNYEVYEGRGGRPAIPTKPPTQTSPQVVAPDLTNQVVAPRIPRGLRAVSKPISRNQGFLKNLNRQTDTFKNKQNTAMNSFNKSQRDAMNTFRTVNKGGYISRAKYGIVNNLKGKK